MAALPEANRCRKLDDAVLEGGPLPGRPGRFGLSQAIHSELESR